MNQKVKDLFNRKAKFAEFLVEKFSEKELEKYDIKILEFPDFDTFKYSDELKLFDFPGIYGIHCFATNHTFVSYSHYITQRICYDFYDLKNSWFNQSKKLQKDFNKNDFDCFIFIIFCINREWTTIEKLEKKCDNIKSFWPYSLYQY